ncbi:MAG: hypothetical protein IJK60_03455 [Clostridia bacterium]|nr:hypothetical protein [Clostridia bacterium]
MNDQDFTVKTKSIHCSNCNAPLTVPKNNKGVVKCPYCQTECVIEGLAKNAEIADKENINSGIPLSAEQSKLHNIVLDIITESPAMPLDLLEKVEITKEEKLCIPAYLYYCNGTISFSYEAGNTREHKNVYDRGDVNVIEKEEYTEWTQMMGNAAATASLIVPGNREFSKIIDELYNECDTNELVDIEELDFPVDIETYNYNLPQSAAFNEYVKPYMDELLEQKAKESLKGKRVRNLSTAGGSNIQKDEIVRLFIGIYHIIYKYKEKEYSVYVSGDGKRYTFSEVPVDEERQSKIDSKLEDIKNVPNKTILPIIGIVVSAIVALLTFNSGHTFIAILGVIAAIACVVFFFIKKNEHDSAAAVIQQELDAYMEQATKIQNDFKQKGRKLKGIYHDID